MAQYSYLPNIFLLHLLTLMILISMPVSGDPVRYDVTRFGADKTGNFGSTKAFLATWAIACQSTKPAEFYVPEGVFLVGYLLFEGPCKSFMSFTNSGTIKAPLNYTNPTVISAWIKFYNIIGMSFTGGIIDGSGRRLWACKSNKGDCPLGSTVCFFSSYMSNIYHFQKNYIQICSRFNSPIVAKLQQRD